MEDQRDVRSEHRRQKEKFTYYLIALCVTSISYAVHITLGQSISYSKIPFGLPVLSWAVSIFWSEYSGNFPGIGNIRKKLKPLQKALYRLWKLIMN